MSIELCQVAATLQKAQFVKSAPSCLQQDRTLLSYPLTTLMGSTILLKVVKDPIAVTFLNK